MTPAPVRITRETVDRATGRITVQVISDGTLLLSEVTRLMNELYRQPLRSAATKIILDGIGR